MKMVLVAALSVSFCVSVWAGGCWSACKERWCYQRKRSLQLQEHHVVPRSRNASDSTASQDLNKSLLDQEKHKRNSSTANGTSHVRYVSLDSISNPGSLAEPLHSAAWV